MKTNILYVYGYGEMPDSNNVKELQNKLDKKKYKVISDYYAQYNPKEALKDINNYIHSNNIQLVIGEHLGGYLVSLIDNDKIEKVLIDPLIEPAYELSEYEMTQPDGSTIKLVPPHIIKFYKENDLKPNYNNTHCMFSTNENYEDYHKLVEDCAIYENPLQILIEQLNSI